MAKLLIALLLIGAGIYYYQHQHSAAKEGSIKSLLDRASSSPVSSDEARVAFIKAASEICAINGTDPAGGVGTTEECLNRLHEKTDQMCAPKAIPDPSKSYASSADLKSAFSVYMHCALPDLSR